MDGSIHNFDDAIPDFDKPIVRREGSVEEYVEPEPVVSMHPDELEALKQQVFNQGKEEGIKETHDALTTQFGSAIERVIQIAEDRQKADSDLFLKASQGFTETVSEIISFLSDEGLDKSTLKRLVDDDVSELIESIKENVTLTCSPDDLENLKTVLGKHTNITFKEDDSLHYGDIRVEWDDSSISISYDDWKKKVHKQIMDTVYSISQKQDDMKD